MTSKEHIRLIAFFMVLCFLLLYPALGLSETVISDSEAGNYIGKSVTVKGTVANVFTSAKGTTFLNFGRPYPNQVFVAVIFSSDSGRFGNLHQWEGKTVAVKGIIKMYKGKPEIILKDPSQLILAK